jgi:arylsulfatase A-like enzyme
MVHVPLILYVGESLRNALENVPPSVVTGTVSNIDIAPTVARLVGIQPHPSWQGVDVLDPDYTGVDRPVFSLLQLTRWMETVCINRLKYVYDLTDIQEKLFDLNDDPGETRNLVEERPELAAALKEMLGAWHTRQLAYYAPSNRPFTHYLERYEPDTALLDRLRAAESGLNP